MSLVELAHHKQGQGVVKYKWSQILLFLVFCLQASMFKKHIIVLMTSIAVQFLNTDCAHFSVLDFCDFFHSIYIK